MVKIQGGYILTAKKSKDSDIWIYKPAWWWKVWNYILMNVNYEENKKFKRAQNFFNSGMIYYGCHLYNDSVKQKSVNNVVRWLQSEGMIVMHKTTRGYVITVKNYDIYQDILSYKNTTGITAEVTPHQPDKCPPNNHYNISNKEKEIKNKKTFSQNSNEFQLANHLLTLILKRAPNFKKPDLQKWAKDIEIMIRLDKRASDEIREIISWCQQDEFWQNNILSTTKLRKQYDQLRLKMKTKSKYI